MKIEEEFGTRMHAPTPENFATKHRMLSEDIKSRENSKEFRGLKKGAKEQSRLNKIFFGSKRDDVAAYKERTDIIKEKRAENDEAAKKMAGEFAKEAYEIMEMWEDYVNVQIRMAKELGIEPNILEDEAYFLSVDKILKSSKEFGNQEISIKTAAKFAGIKDLLQPKLERGSNISDDNGEEFIEKDTCVPIKNFGTIDPNEAFQKAREQNMKKVLVVGDQRLVANLKKSMGAWNNIYDTIPGDTRYAPISDETADIIKDIIKKLNLDLSIPVQSKYNFDFNKKEPRRIRQRQPRIYREIDYSVQDIEELSNKKK